MDAPKGEALTDADAEAVLMALGPLLEWREVVADFAWHARAGKVPYFRLYVVEREAGGTAWRSLLRELAQPEQPRPSPVSHRHESFQEAKAACERHEATGQWEERGV